MRGVMATKPPQESLQELTRFLNRCETAANLPPAPTLVRLGLLSDLLGPLAVSQASLASTALGGTMYPRTLAEVLEGRKPPFETAETLEGDRAARIAQLAAWLHRFPAFVWLRQQPALASGFEAFKRVSKRRPEQAKFADDCAHFRYWAFAAEAVMVLELRSMPQPAAGQRRRAGAAAQKLGEIVNATSLLSLAGIDYTTARAFVFVLERIQALATHRRRKRFDAHYDDRAYINILALIAYLGFGDAPPSVVCEVAALKVRNPDKVSITKQVSDFKKAQRAGSASM